ncbi:CotY/CotZ family spore coat protein [Bhargavaea ginsengi]|uniref:CotY/CotZ family spore coat protein n=1 Tax=Bhargavaea ginsengi TaxID=426757 RepID=UPI00203E9743|nr:CotY/CotZ family spore coat protein [Bhargavaea ginsengi]MCM3088173.1 CotY/CotZ family spore coat protein [Bhargavaea ginsengi]
MSCCGDKKDFTAGSSSFDHCLCDVVRAIKDIQDAGADECMGCNSCFTTPLGGLVNPTTTPIDTRVIVLYSKDGCPFSLSAYPCNPTGPKSCYFRIEEIVGKCCVTLRLLKKEKDPTTPERFEATSRCITVDIRCFCAIECVADAFLDICM